MHNAQNGGMMPSESLSPLEKIFAAARLYIWSFLPSQMTFVMAQQLLPTCHA
jgi:hypothetical protein